MRVDVMHVAYVKSSQEKNDLCVCVCVSVLVWEVVGCVFELIQSVDFWKKKKNNSLKLAVSEVLLCVDTIIFPL